MLFKREKMNDQQKIKLGAEIYNKCTSFMGLKEGDPDSMSTHWKKTCIKIAEFTINKVQELTENNQNTTEISNSTLTCTCYNLFGPETDDNGYICGVCYSLKCNECIDNDFEICPICDHAGKIKIRLHDKNGCIFESGSTLRNEKSLATSLQILQINETHILSEPGGLTEIQDFIDAGWIVHERITPYKFESDCIILANQCEFKSCKIGSNACQKCEENKETNKEQDWVICELYNKENEDGK